MASFAASVRFLLTTFIDGFLSLVFANDPYRLRVVRFTFNRLVFLWRIHFLPFVICLRMLLILLFQAYRSNLADLLGRYRLLQAPLVCLARSNNSRYTAWTWTLLRFRTFLKLLDIWHLRHLLDRHLLHLIFFVLSHSRL